jgi:Cu/Ag efflux protein CusF
MRHLFKIVCAGFALICLLAPLPLRAFQPSAKISVQRKVHRAVGVIEDINRKESWIKIKHENIPNVMPAMTMVFEARNKTILRNRKSGEKIEFWFEEKSFVVVKINRL